MLAHTVFLRSCSRNAKGIPFVVKNEQVCVRGTLLDCIRIAPSISIWYERQEKKGKSAAYASKASLVVHPRPDLVAGNQRMRHEQAILNPIAH
jgi:hypothetical protein